MNKKNIAANAVLNIIKSICRFIFPLITYPYALRILGAENIGKVAYSASIVSYFSMLAVFGVETYGIREGAKLRENKEELQVFANEIFTINLLSTVVAYVLLFAVLAFVPKLNGYKYLILIQSISLVFSTLGMDWINVMFEDFLMITVRSIVIQIVTMLCLFLFVKTPGDYYVYALFSVIGNCVICFSNWFYVRKYLKVRLILKPNIEKHFRPLLCIFFNSIAVSIYVNLDTTMLGWIKGDMAVGYYSVAGKIYSIIKDLLIAAYAVTIPRLSGLIGDKNNFAYKQLYSKVCSSLSLLLIPAGIGLICSAEEVLMLLGGEEYLCATCTLRILSIALIFAIFGGLVTAVLNITTGREKDNLIATVISAAANFGLNLFFIPWLSQNGAAITTVIAEAFVFIFCLAKVKNITDYVDFRYVFKNVIDATVGSTMIVLVSILVKLLIGNWAIRLIVIVTSGVCVYFGFLVLRKNEITIKFIKKNSFKGDV